MNIFSGGGTNKFIKPLILCLQGVIERGLIPELFLNFNNLILNIMLHLILLVILPGLAHHAVKIGFLGIFGLCERVNIELILVYHVFLPV